MRSNSGRGKAPGLVFWGRSAALSVLVLSTPLLLTGLNFYPSPNAAAWRPLLYIFVGATLIDYVVGKDVRSPAVGPSERRAGFLRYVLLGAVPIQIGVLIWSVGRFSSGVFDVWGSVGWLASVGVVNGTLGLCVGHELLHTPSRLARSAAGMLFAGVSYGSFFVEHLRGHHLNFATPLDPSTARQGESLYHFLPRAIFGNVRSAWRLQAERMRRNSRRVFGPENPLIGLFGLSVLYAASSGWIFGWRGALFFLGQSGVAICLLETVNYIEHYGLVRRKRPDGRYEAPTAAHAWEAAYRVSNMYLLQLPRHADHHLRSSRPFASLRHLEGSPQLPGGYSAMVALACIPPLWRRLVDRRIPGAGRPAGETVQ